MSCEGLFILIETDVPILFLVCTPGWIIIEPLQVCEHNGQIFNAVSTERLQKLKRVPTIRAALALGSVLISMRDLKETIMDQILSQHATNLSFKGREAP